MKNIKVESSKNYYHGFVLNEQELRRIVQTCEEQFVKIKSDGQCFSKYEVRFENGVVAETISLDSIFNLENSGNIKGESLETVLEIFSIQYKIKYKIQGDSVVVLYN